MPKIDLVCETCGRAYRKHRTLVHKRTFCSIQCRDEKLHHEKYGGLPELFSSQRNVNAVSYFVGLILGDGNIRVRQKRTALVTVSFNANERTNIEIAKDILDSLGVAHSVYTDANYRCSKLGFSIPTDILVPIGLGYTGDKYRASPTPPENITKNINYAAGLFNSDGCRDRKTGNLSFHNTTKSIVDSYAACLEANEIPYKRYARAGRYDARTGATNKSYHSVYIFGVEHKTRFDNLVHYRLKGVAGSNT